MGLDKKGLTKNNVFFLISAAALLLFAYLIIAVSQGNLNNINENVLLFSSKFHNSYLTQLALFIHYSFTYISLFIFAIIVFIYMWIKHRSKEESILLIALIITTIFLYITKSLIHEARPLNALITLTDFSFPSGHSAFAVVLIGLLAYFLLSNIPKKRQPIIYIIAAFLILLVAYSRLYLGVHWFTDVLAGLSLGIFILFLSIMVLDSVRKKKIKNNG
ncbi:MAG: phosphatase PAP2 family protein [Nanoarchaeota archaeon]|nr:phosphatase PAP2 family protein [Nanoarchaeota archaeon]